MNLAARVQWFLDHLDSDTPTQMHKSQPRCAKRHGRGGSVTKDGLASQLGSPALASNFERWLFAAQARTTDVLEVTCYHVGVEEGVPCPTCAALVEGELYETSIRRVERERYCWPMRAAIARLHNWPRPSSRPRLSETLLAIERVEGDLALAAETLTRRYPAMGDPTTALAHFDVALRVVQDRWREDAPPRLLPRSGDDLSKGLAS